MPPAGLPESENLAAPRAAFGYRDFRLFQGARLIAIVAMEMQALVISWQVYEATRRPLDLGLVGLSQFLPAILLFPIVGQAADRFDRRRIIMVCNALLVTASGLLLWQSLQPSTNVRFVFAASALIGTVRAFNGPASQSLLPEIVPAHHFPNAVAWASSVFMIATIVGPSLGGFVYAVGKGAPLAYAMAALMYATALLFISLMDVRTGRMEQRSTSLATIVAGLRYVWEKKVVLGSISLDLFAVLLGGAIALLPVVAAEVLNAGPTGLAILRASPAVGAALTGAFLAYFPLRKNSGSIMFWCVAIFGAATIGFGLSHTLWISVLLMFIAGASDMVSVVIRATLVQIATPPDMRGRVAAVNLLFIGASNELGQFESGLTAQWFGTVPAVVLGGIGTIAVVLLWLWMFPELRDVDSLTAPAAPEAASGSIP
jgi:MFS family permease